MTFETVNWPSFNGMIGFVQLYVEEKPIMRLAEYPSQKHVSILENFVKELGKEPTYDQGLRVGNTYQLVDLHTVDYQVAGMGMGHVLSQMYKIIRTDSQSTHYGLGMNQDHFEKLFVEEGRFWTLKTEFR